MAIGVADIWSIEGVGAPPPPPIVTGAFAFDSTTVRVTFDQEMKHVSPGNPDDVLNPANYGFTVVGGVSRSAVSVSLYQANPTQVDVSLDGEMTGGASYTVKVSNTESVAGVVVDPAADSKTFSGIGIQPRVLSATGTASYIRVVFDSDMSDVGLTTPGNYTFVGPTTLTIDHVVKQSSTTVDVYPAEEQQQGGAYTITVANVTDLAGNVIDPAHDSAAFTGTGTSPRLTAAASQDVYTVRLTFSEEVDGTTAQVPGNYSIVSDDTGLPLAVSAAAKINATQVDLTTAEQGMREQYTVTVNNVEDLAGNPIQSPYNTKQFLGIGKTFPIVTFYPEDGSTDVDVHEFFSVHVVDNTEYFSGIDIDSVQISVEYELNGHVVTLDVVVDGGLTSYVDGELSGEAFTTVGLTYRFRFPGGWRPETAYTISVEVADVDGYTANSSAEIVTGLGYSPCEMAHLWKLVPERMREMDADEGHVLREFVGVMQHVFSDICERITNFTSLRDPLEVRTSHNENETIHIVSHTVGDGIVTLRVDDADDLSRASKGWILLDEDGGEFEIVAVRKRIPALPVDYQAPEIDINGLVPPTYTAVTGEQVIRPQSLIEYLAMDYGLDVDRNEPEGFQRSTIYNALQYLDLKGTVAAYRVRGLISGFEVGVFGLWYVSDGMVDSLPGGSFWLNPADGLYYTTTPPMMANYDEIAGDVIPCDQFCWENPGDYEFAISTGSITVVDLGSDGWRVDFGAGADLSLITQIGNWKVVDDPITTPEIIGVGDGSTTAFNPTLGRDSVNPGSLTVEYTSGGTTRTIADDGNGVLTGDVDPNASNTIDYYSGELRFTCAVPPDDSTNIQAVYARDFWVESVETGATPRLYLSAYSTGPLVNGGNWKLRYACPEQQFCWYGKSNKIRIEIEAGKILDEPGADPDSALDRLVKKLLVDIVPAHVVVAFLAYKTYVTAQMTYSVGIDLFPTTMVDAYMVNRFDAIEGSEGT